MQLFNDKVVSVANRNHVVMTDNSSVESKVNDCFGNKIGLKIRREEEELGNRLLNKYYAHITKSCNFLFGDALFSPD